MQLGLETFSYLPFFLGNRMDIFAFITRAHALGLNGVQLNITNAREHWGAIGSIDAARLRDIRQLTETLGLYVEVDTYGMEYDHLATALQVCHALGADVLRTYASTGDVLEGPALQEYMRRGGGLDRHFAEATVCLRRLLPICADTGVRIAIENHEYETSAQVIELVTSLDSDRIGILIDTGNMMTVWEDPLSAVTAMAPYAVSTHFKDHAVILHDDEPYVVGTPVGQGSIDCTACFRILAEQSPLRRINIEVCYGYGSAFRMPEPHGSRQLGRDAFRVVPPPHDPRCISPYPNYLAPSALSPDAWEEQLIRHEQAVVDSVRYVQELNATIHRDNGDEQDVSPTAK